MAELKGEDGARRAVLLGHVYDGGDMMRDDIEALASSPTDDDHSFVAYLQTSGRVK